MPCVTLKAHAGRGLSLPCFANFSSKRHADRLADFVWPPMNDTSRNAGFRDAVQLSKAADAKHRFRFVGACPERPEALKLEKFQAIHIWYELFNFERVRHLGFQLLKNHLIAGSDIDVIKRDIYPIGRRRSQRRRTSAF